jgi:hypothetical protein
MRVFGQAPLHVLGDRFGFISERLVRVLRIAGLGQ